jgi:hypothetical protein
MTLAQIQQGGVAKLLITAFVITTAFDATISASWSFVEPTPWVVVCHVKVRAHGVLAILKSVTVVQLDSPTLFSFSALGVMCALRLAIASCIYLSNSTAESKFWLQAFGKRRAIENFLSFLNHGIRFLQII